MPRREVLLLPTEFRSVIPIAAGPKGWEVHRLPAAWQYSLRIESHVFGVPFLLKMHSL